MVHFLAGVKSLHYGTLRDQNQRVVQGFADHLPKPKIEEKNSAMLTLKPDFKWSNHMAKYIGYKM